MPDRTGSSPSVYLCVQICFDNWLLSVEKVEENARAVVVRVAATRGAAIRAACHQIKKLRNAELLLI